MPFDTSMLAYGSVAYALFCLCFAFPPIAFHSAGVTVEALFSDRLGDQVSFLLASVRIYLPQPNTVGAFTCRHALALPSAIRCRIVSNSPPSVRRGYTLWITQCDVRHTRLAATARWP